MSDIQTFLSRVIILLMLLGGGILGILCEQQILQTEHLDLFDITAVVVVLFYGIAIGIFIALSPQIRLEIQQGKKLIWRAIIYPLTITATPLILWGYALNNGSIFSSLNLLAIMVIGGFMIIGIIFLIDSICLHIWRHYQ